MRVMRVKAEIIKDRGYTRYRAKCPYCGYLNVVTSHHSLGYFTHLGRYISPTSQGVTYRCCRHFQAVDLHGHMVFEAS